MSHIASSHSPLSDEDYDRFRELVLVRTGLMFGERRREALGRAVTENAKRAEHIDLDGYFAYLQSNDTNSPVWDELVKTLTVNETYFFRDPDQIEALRRHILPDLIARHWTVHTLRLWSAGCSTGEEPYTLAILLRQLLPDIDRWKILILATDLNKHALQTAMQARYRVWSFRQTDSALRDAYFSQIGDDFDLKPAIRQMVTFAYLNLAENSYPSPTSNTNSLDLVLCRNVTIYLPERVIAEVAQRFYQSLAPGGWLVVGPSETNDTFYSQFQTLKFAGAIVYQKVAGHSTSSLASSAFTDSTALPDLGAPPTTPVFTPSRPSAIPATAGWAPSPSGPASPQEPARPRLPEVARSHSRPEPLPPPQEPLLPSDETNELYTQGQALLKQRRYEEARRCFLAYLEHHPAEAGTHYQLARLEANAGRLSEARQWAERALQLDLLRSKTHYILALIHQEQAETEQAIACFKKVLYLDPGFVLAHFGLANLYQNTGQAVEADRHRAHALRLASRLPPDEILPGSDDLTAGHLLAMIRDT